MHCSTRATGSVRRACAGTCGPPRLRARFDFELAYRPPLDWVALLAFLAGRAIVGRGIGRRNDVSPHGIDRASRRRAQGLDRSAPSAAHRKPALGVRLAPALSAVIPQVLARVKHLFDLACDPQAVAERLGPLAAAPPGPARAGGVQRIRDRGARGARAAGHREGGAHAGGALRRPLRRAARHTVRRAEHDVSRRSTGLRRPKPHEIGELGILRARARAIQALAQALAAGSLKLEPMVAVEETISGLRALPGFGEWTAQYIAMRALAWPDAFPQARLRCAESARRNRSATGAGPRRNLAAMARLCRHASVEPFNRRTLDRPSRKKQPRTNRATGRWASFYTHGPPGDLPGERHDLLFNGGSPLGHPAHLDGRIDRPVLPGPALCAGAQTPMGTARRSSRVRADAGVARGLFLRAAAQRRRAAGTAGTPFQRRCGSRSPASPAGETITYAELARRSVTRRPCGRRALRRGAIRFPC